MDGIADQVYMKMHGITWRTEILKQMPLSIDEHCYYVDAEYILYPIPWVRTVSFLPDFVYQYRIGRVGRVSARKKWCRTRKITTGCWNPCVHFIRNAGMERLTARGKTALYRERNRPRSGRKSQDPFEPSGG